MLRRPKRDQAAQPTLIGGHLNRLVMAAMITASFCLGMGVDRFGAESVDSQSTLTEAPEFAVLEQTWDLIQNDYVALDQVEQEALFYGAAAGMVDALGDTGHSTFLDPGEAEAFNSNSEGEFVGIGIQLDYETGQPVVAFTIEGSPAEKAGIRSRDVIVAVNGIETDGLGPDLVQEQLLGEEGEEVSLTILRPSTAETLEFTIVRSRIEIRPVSWAMLPDDIALIRISQFSSGVTKDLKATIRAAVREGAIGLVLDLRDNPGGLVFEAIGVASEFIPEGQPIYLYEERNEEPRAIRTVPGGLATDIPMVVLINGGSASAAEITAAALSDNERAVLIGETTFGTGTVLTPFTLEDGSIVLLGTALWLQPDGEPIWKVGLEPDEEVELAPDEDQFRASSDEEVTQEELDELSDVQLQEAFEEILDAVE